MPKVGKQEKTGRKPYQRREKQKGEQVVMAGPVRNPIQVPDLAVTEKKACRCNDTLLAIGRKCLDCSHGSPREVRMCRQERCALFRWRETGLKCSQEKGGNV